LLGMLAALLEAVICRLRLLSMKLVLLRGFGFIEVDQITMRARPRVSQRRRVGG